MHKTRFLQKGTAHSLYFPCPIKFIRRDETGLFYIDPSVICAASAGPDRSFNAICSLRRNTVSAVSVPACRQNGIERKRSASESPLIAGADKRSAVNLDICSRVSVKIQTVARRACKCAAVNRKLYACISVPDAIVTAAASRTAERSAVNRDLRSCCMVFFDCDRRSVAGDRDRIVAALCSECYVGVLIDTEARLSVDDEISAVNIGNAGVLRARSHDERAAALRSLTERSAVDICRAAIHFKGIGSAGPRDDSCIISEEGPAVDVRRAVAHQDPVPSLRGIVSAINVERSALHIHSMSARSRQRITPVGVIGIRLVLRPEIICSRRPNGGARPLVLHAQCDGAAADIHPAASGIFDRSAGDRNTFPLAAACHAHGKTSDLEGSVNIEIPVAAMLVFNARMGHVERTCGGVQRAALHIDAVVDLIIRNRTVCG